jgi:hypothetical protein
MKKFVLLFALIAIPILRLNAQNIQATLRHGSTPGEVYLTIRNNSASNITGNVTKIEFTLSMFLQSSSVTNAFGFTDIYTLPKPGTGSFSSHDYMSMLNNYLTTIWTGSKAINLDPSEEMDLVGFTLWGSTGPLTGGSPSPTLYLRYADPFYVDDRNWLVELDGVSVTEGQERFYSQTPSTTVSNDFFGSNLDFGSFNLESLPVTLVKFEGRQESGIVNMSWATTEETNSDHFDIEHSINGKTWRSLGTLKAQGESTKLHEYLFSHKDPNQGANYYRLKMIDIDQTFAFSKIVNVNVIGIQSAGVYPNPVIDRVFFKANDLQNATRVQVLNTSGKVVQEAVNVGASGMDVRHLPSGLFIIKLNKADGEVIHYKLIKK